MIHHDAAGFRASVGIPATGEAGDDPTFSSNNVDRPAGLSGAQIHVRASVCGDARLRRRCGPAHIRLGQGEARARNHAHDCDRRVLALDDVFQNRLVVALGAQKRLGGLHRPPRAAAGLEAVGGRPVNLSNRPYQLGAQFAVDLTPDLRARVGRRRRSHHESGRAEQEQGGP